MSDRIQNMRTYFFAPDRTIDAPTFAASMLRTVRAQAVRQLQQTGFVQAELLECGQVALGDPNAPALDAAPLYAYVNHGEWKVRCDQDSGIEYADLDWPVFMCCRCWNGHLAHAWRPVVVPVQLRAIEQLLLRRPLENRHFHPERGETLRDLARENRKYGLDWHVRAEE